MDQSKQSLRILYLEDEPDFTKWVKALLEDAGMRADILFLWESTWTARRPRK